jgi:hypothetical protein
MYTSEKIEPQITQMNADESDCPQITQMKTDSRLG